MRTEVKIIVAMAERIRYTKNRQDTAYYMSKRSSSKANTKQPMQNRRRPWSETLVFCSDSGEGSGSSECGCRKWYIGNCKSGQPSGSLRRRVTRQLW